MSIWLKKLDVDASGIHSDLLESLTAAGTLRLRAGIHQIPFSRNIPHANVRLALGPWVHNLEEHQGIQRGGPHRAGGEYFSENER